MTERTDPTPRERLLAAMACEPVDRPPVWFMRQAGRYLPEYRKIRREHSFLEVCHAPELACRVTLQPVERFGLDAAIIFSDILVPFEGLGHPVTYEPGKGPVVEDPVRSPEAVDALSLPDPQEAFPALPEAIASVRERLPSTGVIGFAGAPLTLATYLVEGASPKRYEHVSRLRLEHPAAFERLLDTLAETVARQLACQVQAGADAVQLFDTHAEPLDAGTYRDVAAPATRKVLEALEDLDVPRIVFARGTAHLLEPLTDLPAEVISVDWRIPLSTVAPAAPDRAVQGNLDPALLYGSPDGVTQATRRVLADGAKAAGHVFNLGHGIHPKARIETVEAMVRTVQGWERG